MQNKKLLYILTFIITLFTFNINVNAAQELTCVYKKDPKKDKVMLIQTKQGVKTIYTNTKDVGKDEDGWTKRTDLPYDTTNVTTGYDDFRAHLTSCPSYSSIEIKNNKEIVVFSSKTITNGMEIEEKSSTKISIAQELTCVYEKKNSNTKIILVQDSTGQKIIYSNKKDSMTFDSSWEREYSYKYDLSGVTDEWDKGNQENLALCPKYMDTTPVTKTISFRTKLKSEYDRIEYQFFNSNLIGGTTSSSNSNIQAKELTCVYKKGATTRKVILTQNRKGNRTLYTNESNEAIDGVDWVKNKYSINIYFESLNEYGNLEKCPGYANAPLVENKVDFFENPNLFNHDTWLPEGLEDGGEYDEVKEIGRTLAGTPSNKEGLLIELDESKHTGWCKYKKMVDNGEYHYVQINYGKENILITEWDPEKTDIDGKNYSGKDETGYYCLDTKYNSEGMLYCYEHEFKIDTGFTPAYFLDLNGGKCPIGIKVTRKNTTFNSAYDDGTPYLNTKIKTKINSNAVLDTALGDLYGIDSTGGYNPLTGEELTLADALKPIEFIKVEINNCADLVGEEVAGYLNVVWNIVKIGVPIILIGMGTVDFVQVIFSGKEDEMKKAKDKFIKRIIIAIIIFLIPALLTFLLNIANGIWDNIGTDICGIIF